MVCSCCGRWTVEQVLVSRGGRAGPRLLLRVKHHGFLVGEFTSANAAANELERAGVLALMVTAAVR